MKLKLKRAYEPAAKTDGTRVLVDRLWPRGVSKKAARIDLWLKEIAPARNCGNGSATTPRDGRSSRRSTSGSSMPMPTRSSNSANSSAEGQ